MTTKTNSPPRSIATMKMFWDERYGQEEYVYGEDPNDWFRICLANLSPGRILLPAEGEGRNAVHAAREGWTVHAFDYSRSGQQKALQLAARHGVTIDYQLQDAAAVQPEPQSYDALALIYAHFPEDQRRTLFSPWQAGLKPGGILIMEVFSTGQIACQERYQSGGPKVPELLYRVEDLPQLFPEIVFDILEETEVNLAEGAYHTGPARVIRARGKRQA